MFRGRNCNPITTLSAALANAANHRKHGRVLCQEIQCTLGEVLDLSASGMKIRTRVKLPKQGDFFSTTLETLDGPMMVGGRVIWERKLGVFKREAGIRFEGLSPEILRALTALARASAHNEVIRPEIAEFRDAKD